MVVKKNTASDETVFFAFFFAIFMHNKILFNYFP